MKTKLYVVFKLLSCYLVLGHVVSRINYLFSKLNHHLGCHCEPISSIVIPEVPFHKSNSLDRHLKSRMLVWLVSFDEFHHKISLLVIQ